MSFRRVAAGRRADRLPAPWTLPILRRFYAPAESRCVLRLCAIPYWRIL
jgi:hypothetical protein